MTTTVSKRYLIALLIGLVTLSPFISAAALDRETCKAILSNLSESDTQAHGLVRAAAISSLRSLTDEQVALLTKYGFEATVAGMSDADSRMVIDVELDNQVSPRKPDIIASPPSESEIRARLARDSEAGYVFLDTSSWVPPELQNDIRAVPREMMTTARLIEGKFRVRGEFDSHLPTDLDVWPRPAAAIAMMHEMSLRVARVTAGLTHLTDQIAARVLAYLDPNEAQGLKVTQAIFRSGQGGTGIGRHVDAFYLRAAVSISGLPTWVWDPSRHAVVGAPEGWGLVFSGTLRSGEGATAHYGPTDLQNMRRDVLFVDLSP